MCPAPHVEVILIVHIHHGSRVDRDLGDAEVAEQIHR
jgi:hypothetical protein